MGKQPTDKDSSKNQVDSGKNAPVKQKNKGGRPKGSVNKNGYAVVLAIRSSFDKAMGLLDSRGTPLEEIIARELEENTPRMLQALSQYMPKQVDVQVSAEDSYLESLKKVQVALKQQVDKAEMIDVTPGNVSTDKKDS